MKKAKYCKQGRKLLEGLFCASLLIDNLEHLQSDDPKSIGGLCTIPKHLNYIGELKEDRAYQVLKWLRDNLPPAKKYLNLYCWEAGDVDRRYYWLRNKLVEYRNELKNYG